MHLVKRRMTFPLTMLFVIGAARLYAVSGFSRASSFTRSRFASEPSRHYSQTKLSMKLQTAIVGLPNVGKVCCPLLNVVSRIVSYVVLRVVCGTCILIVVSSSTTPCLSFHLTVDVVQCTDRIPGR